MAPPRKEQLQPDSENSSSPAYAAHHHDADANACQSSPPSGSPINPNATPPSRPPPPLPVADSHSNIATGYPVQTGYSNEPELPQWPQPPPAFRPEPNPEPPIVNPQPVYSNQTELPQWPQQHPPVNTQPNPEPPIVNPQPELPQWPQQHPPVNTQPNPEPPVVNPQPELPQWPRQRPPVNPQPNPEPPIVNPQPELPQWPQQRPPVNPQLNPEPPIVKPQPELPQWPQQHPPVNPQPSPEPPTVNPQPELPRWPQPPSARPEQNPETTTVNPQPGYSTQHQTPEWSQPSPSVQPPQKTEQPISEAQIGIWTTGLCSCHEDPANCLVTAFCPCVTFGQIAEIVDQGNTTCGTGALIYSAILCCCGIPCIYSCSYRTKLRARFNLEGAPMIDTLIHCALEHCALCQEYRELANRGLDPAIGWVGNVTKYQQQQQAAMAPPSRQAMCR
eukprot:PITA_11187